MGKYTEEQLAIINCNDPVVIGNSLSGSGKSHTAVGFSEARRDKKVLYLVFNSSMKKEATSDFKNLSNVTVLTTHGLAYREFGSKYKHKLVKGNYRVTDLIRDLRLPRKEYDYASKVLRLYNKYLISSFKTIDELIDYEFKNKTTLSNNMKSSLEALWKEKLKVNGGAEIEHDFYMKLYHLSKPTLDEYDVLIVDECLTGNHYVSTDVGDIKLEKLYDMYINNEDMPNALSYNIDMDRYEYKPVVWSKKSPNREILSIKLSNGAEIRCTPDHKILCRNEYVQAKDLSPNWDFVTLSNGKMGAIKSIEPCGNEDVFDIEVEDNHNFCASISKNSTKVVVHNCQDSNRIVKDIFDNANCEQKVAIGDSNQALYSWRGAKDIMNKINGTRLDLTRSFRVSQATANICNKIFKEFLGKDLNMKGMNDNQKVEFAKNFNLCNNKATILCRTNSTVLAHALECADRDKSICFIGGIKGYKLDFYKACYYFMVTGQTKDRVLSKYDDWKDLVRSAEETEDVELLSMINIIKIYNVRIPNGVDKIKELVTTNQKSADITISTVHKSKGLSIDGNLLVEKDVIDLNVLRQTYTELIYSGGDINMAKKEIEQELNLLYVALTRSRNGTLYINSMLENYIKGQEIIIP